MESKLDEQGSVALYSPYWLIVKHHGLRMSVFTLELGGEKVLPVFSHVEEAGTFLRALGGQRLADQGNRGWGACVGPLRSLRKRQNDCAGPASARSRC
jgi:hypothetical protein